MHARVCQCLSRNFGVDSDIVVNFVEEAYSVREGDGLLVMYIELSEGAVERQLPSFVEVQLTTLDISTEGASIRCFLFCAHGLLL